MRSHTSKESFLLPSKSTRPSPLRSTSWRISLISLLVTCSPISFFMASRSSIKLIWPSPLESNWEQRAAGNRITQKGLNYCSEEEPIHLQSGFPFWNVVRKDHFPIFFSFLQKYCRDQMYLRIFQCFQLFLLA